jgi:hypothetical protein
VGLRENIQEGRAQHTRLAYDFSVQKAILRPGWTPQRSLFCMYMVRLHRPERFGTKA